MLLSWEVEFFYRLRCLMGSFGFFIIVVSVCSGGWSRVYGVCYPRMVPKGSALVRFLIIKKKKKVLLFLLGLICFSGSFCFSSKKLLIWCLCVSVTLMVEMFDGLNLVFLLFVDGR
jgi:hypothetical protein